MTPSTAPDEEVVLSVWGALGRITLNRPRALNSLTLSMVRTIHQAMRSWRDSPDIEAVLIEGAGERGLCAGGDVRAIYDAAKTGDDLSPRTFWDEEYRLNASLPHYPKPVIAVMDGICMGGGVGISAHGSHRVVTERSSVGMPEVGIGFAPDVGGSFLLSRAPGELGTHLALTGLPVSGSDAIHCGLADYYVESGDLEELLSALAGGAVERTLGKFAAPPPRSWLAEQREWIDEAYSAPHAEHVVQRLRARPEEVARSAAETIGTRSPVSVKVTLEALRRARQLATLEQALDQEFRVSLGCLRVGDFVEGVRATLVDKDRVPRWSPARLEDVDTQLVAQFFEPLGTHELGLAH